jgi:uncharacterized protein (TIGR02284 family)
MANHNEEQIGALNKLIDILRDGNSGYKSAAEKISDEEIRTILYRLSQQRALFEAELKDEIRTLGGEPDYSSITKQAGNTWSEFIKMIRPEDKHGRDVIQKCQKEEEQALEVYEEVLKNKHIPDYIKEKITRQHHLIKGACVQLREFERDLK